MRKKSILVLFFFIFLGGLWVFPAIISLNGVLFHPRAEYSDILLSHWPNMQFISNAWNTWGEFPLWNPLILSGAPLVGDPLFGIWYPPNWLAMLLPIPVTFNILMWIHLAWAGIGMFQWLKSENIGWGGALIAGIAFSGTPKLIGHIALGHLGLVSAVAWTPWLLLITRRIVISSCIREERSLRWYSLGGAIAAMLFLADLRWILPALCLAILYSLRLLRKKELKILGFAVGKVREISASVIIFIGLISGLALPLIEFTARSTRSNLSFDEITELSLPFNSLLGLFIPNYEGWPETLTYLGLIVVGLALIAILGKGEGWLFWSSMAIGFLLLSFGDHTPFYRLIFRVVPGLAYLRVPARFFYIFSFSLAALAGIGFDLLFNGTLSNLRIKRVRLGIVGFGGLILLMAIGALIILQRADGVNEFPWQHMVVAAFLFIGFGFLSLRGLFRANVGIALWSAALIVDLFFVNQSLIEIRSLEDLSASSDVIREISISKSGYMRIFSPSYSISQHEAVMADLQLADGVNPLQQRSYWGYMAEAVGFDKEGYSVTLPPFPDGDNDQHLYTSLNGQALGLLNVATVISDYPLDNPALIEISMVGGKYLYRNAEFRPRAWIEDPAEGNDRGWRDVQRVEWSPNSITIMAMGPGELVLSELDYPGWRATINGVKAAISPHMGLLRSVELTAETSLVEFQYRPWTVFLGAGFTMFTFIILVVIWRRK